MWALDLGVHFLSLEHEKSTGVLANLKRKLTEFKRKLAVLKPIIPGFDQLDPGNCRN